MMTSWKYMLEKNSKANDDVIRTVCIMKPKGEDEDESEAILVDGLDHELLSKEFDDGYGAPEGVPFTAWGDKRVYFPYTYDGAEGVSSVPRDPVMEPTMHVGGW